jgi:CMP-N-acetylneuraminic acid synthetase
MWVNGCQPFLKNSTILKGAGAFHSHREPMTTVVQSREILWDSDGPLFLDADEHRSDRAYKLMRSSHSFHVFNRKFLLENAKYWEPDRNTPRLFEIEDKREVLDADSELDFEILSALRRIP